MTAPSVEVEAPALDLDAVTVDDMLTAIRHALAAGDMKGVVALLHLLALKDPAAAETIVELFRLVAAINAREVVDSGAVVP